MTERAELLAEPHQCGLATSSADPGTCVAVVCPDSALDAAYFAAGLARHLVLPERPEAINDIVLVDGLPGTGGLDLIADLDDAPGPRWSALRGAVGAIDAERLLQALPCRDGIAVLAHDRAVDTVDDAARGRALSALADQVSWLVGTQPPDRLPDACFSCVVLLVRGSVAGIAAAERYAELLGDEMPLVIVSLETPAATRIAVSDALRRPIITAAPTRWKLPHAAGSDVVCGAWPGTRDRVLRRLFHDVGVYLRSRGRSRAWV